MLFKGYGAKVGLGNMRVKAENRMVTTPPIESSGNWLKYNAARNIIFFDTYHPGKPNANNILKEAYEKPLREYSNHLKNKK